jgi:preprotein translocase subunit SecG
VSGTIERFTLTSSTNALANVGGGGLSSNSLLSPPIANAGVIDALDRVSIFFIKLFLFFYLFFLLQKKKFLVHTKKIVRA